MKTKKLLAFSLIAATMGLYTPSNAFAKGPAPDLFDDFDVQQNTKKVLPKKAVPGRNRSVNVHADLLDEDVLTLNLFNDVVVTAELDRIVKDRQDKIWIGHVKGEQDSEVFLTVHGNAMSGNVQIGKDTYEIEFKGNGMYDITQVDLDKVPKHSHSKIPKGAPAAGEQTGAASTTGSPTTSQATAGTVIDLLVVYTTRAKNNASGQAGIESKITNAVAMANQAYINSKVDMQLNLVGMKEVTYAETGDMSVSLNDLTGTSDGKMDEVHTWRNQYGADQVSLITADANYCGIGYMMTSSWINTAFAAYAFSVVHDDSVYACLSGNTMAHELGHNQGDQHNIEDNGGYAGAYSYSYGYRLCQTGGFRTIMSYSCTGGTRVSYFSNPNVTLTTGEVTGSSAANNALSMNNTKSIVASFRSAVDSSVPNAPGNLTATAVSDSAIALVWSDNSGNETGFRVERSLDGANWNEIAVTGSNTVSFNNIGLSAGTTYFYRVRAYNSNGFSAYSNNGSALTVAAVCTGNTPALSMAPTSVYTKPNAPVSFNISLTNQDTSACAATTFTLINSDGVTLGAYSLSPGASASTNWSIAAPATDGTYTKSVTLSAAAHGNATASASIVVDGTAPTAPASVTTTKTGRKSVAISWKASTDIGSGMSAYSVSRNGSLIGTTTSTSFKDNAAPRGTNTYEIRANDKAGNFSSSQQSIAMSGK